MPTRKTMIRLLEFRICLLMFLLHNMLYTKTTKIRGYKCSTAVSHRTFILQNCYRTSYNVLQNNKAVPVLSIIMFEQWSCSSRTLGDDSLIARCLT